VALVLGITGSHAGLLQLLPNALMRRLHLLLLGLPQDGSSWHCWSR